MFSNHKFIGDYQKPAIKPSLHELTTDTILSKSLAQKKRINERNSYSTPFRVILNEVIPQFSTDNQNKEPFNRSEPKNDGCNGVSDRGSVNRLQNGLHKWMPNNNFSFGDNRDNNPFLNKSSIGLNPIEFKNSSTTAFNQINGRTNRLYNSCPSSPVSKRFEQNSKQVINRNERLIKFDGLHGSEVTLSQDMYEISRLEDKSIGNCYAFVGQPLVPGFRITVQIIGLQESDVRQSFIFGVTNVKPSHISASDLPNDPKLLIERRGQLWTLVDNFCDNCKLKDMLSFDIDQKGFVSLTINSYCRSVLFPVQTQNQELWPFFDIIGRIKAIKLISPNNRSVSVDKPLMNSNLFDMNSAKHLYKCINCLSNFANTAFYRCGHKYYCNRCAKLYFDSTKKCPLCYQTIFDLIVIFP